MQIAALFRVSLSLPPVQAVRLDLRYDPRPLAQEVTTTVPPRLVNELKVRYHSVTMKAILEHRSPLDRNDMLPLPLQKNCQVICMN